ARSDHGRVRGPHGTDEGREAGSHGAADEAAERTLRPGGPARGGRHDDAWQADPGGRARTTTARCDLGTALANDAGGNQGTGPFPAWLHAAAASESSRGRHGVSPASH